MEERSQISVLKFWAVPRYLSYRSRLVVKRNCSREEWNEGKQTASTWCSEQIQYNQELGSAVVQLRRQGKHRWAFCRKLEPSALLLLSQSTQVKWAERSRCRRVMGQATRLCLEYIMRHWAAAFENQPFQQKLWKHFFQRLHCIAALTPIFCSTIKKISFCWQ